jgi:hypothetical protein
MHDNRALVAAGRAADTAAIVVPFQNLLPQTAEAYLILALEV